MARKPPLPDDHENESDPRAQGPQTGAPSREAVLQYLEENPRAQSKRDIARAFKVKGDDRIALKELLRELEREGLLTRQGRGRLAQPGSLPEVTVLDVVDTDSDGELLARPTTRREDDPPVTIYVAQTRRGPEALTPGDRVLARLSRIEPGVYEARPIRVLSGAPKRVLGLYERGDRGGRLRPVDKGSKADFSLAKEDAGDAKVGELVLAEVKPRHGRFGPRPVRVLERLGAVDNPKALSLISIHEQGLPTVFSRDALEEAKTAEGLTVAGAANLGLAREDLRDIPLVTIDGEDARDFDDAVWAQADDDPDNPGGWQVLVAIADVAHYVRPGSALDRSAYERGNSAYFPDRVVPMLPEALSNGWCSLNPKEERSCLAARLWLSADGDLVRHAFTRGIMRSAARLTYEQVQAARDGGPDDTTGPLLDPVIKPLYGAYEALQRAREARGTLDLDLPEWQVLFDDQGAVSTIRQRQRLDSHRLIEEFMITANVAAAETLERQRQPCMYRVHAPPDPQKVEALRQVLRSLEINLAKGQVIRPKVFSRVLEQVAGRPESQMVSSLVLRCQSQAAYAPNNVGHFGLALGRYAHFTSPIRRYADLLVHRALISGLGLGDDGLPPEAGAGFDEAGQHISDTERRAMIAERDAVDRFTASYLQTRIGAVFRGRVTGVTRFGLFVALADCGGDGLVPRSSLTDDRYDHDEARHCLIGRRWGRVFQLGDPLWVRLEEASPVSGGLILSLVEDGDSEDEEPDSGDSGQGDGWDPLQGQPRRRVQQARRGKPGSGGKSHRGRAKPRRGR